ncbi:centrosomal protein CEP57L1 isoform X1 [Coregonus clupeaformis]|uniref:centrosomal protein CEP57L1 isoform X1 n=1 Tax=Coregonus clupeaformis TaxID=59861 RepID=UPI001E1C9424|nr:centrosomal protein CEP57L1 isoform X1 [Coregonus clupeaformis]
MEAYQDQLLDSPSKNSYIGSYYQPPDRLSPSYVREAPAPLTKTAMNLQNITPQVYRTTPDAGSKAVIAALKTLQEKILRLEQERKQAEKNVKQFSQAAHGYEHSVTPCYATEADGSRKKERVTPLQGAEARCQLLEKQLDYMRKMVENAEKDKNTLTEKQVSLQKQRLQNSSDAHTPLEKLEKLERDCLKLSKTQSVAERKIELLEQKLLEEEHERKLVQEKADELQRELETNLRLCPVDPDEVKPKKKSKTASRKTSLVRQEAPAPPGFPKNKLPFVAGTSTSPSHSVHANMQSILHMMKHHQPQLCERVRSLRRSGSTGARRALHRAPSTSPPGPAGLALGSLSELLLALQDELGQMSFEHQELVCQMDETRRRETREDLERELELLVKRMEEKGSQITKLRKHQQTVDKLTQNPQNPRRRATSEDGRSKGGSGVRPLPPSPVKTTSRGGKRAGVSQEENLQLLRETQRLCTSLKKDDITWET